MRQINSFQKVIIAMAALAIASRLFFPATRETRFGEGTDIPTTLLQVAGIAVFLGAAFYLGSLRGGGRFRSTLPVTLILFGWSSLVAIVVIGINRIGVARSVFDVHWPLAGLTLGGFVALLWLSWLVLQAQRARPLPERRHYTNLSAIALVLLLILSGFIAQHYQDRRLSAQRALRIDFERELYDLRYGIVEGERVGPVKLGMSRTQVDTALAKRFDSGERLPNGLNSYIWSDGQLRRPDGWYLGSQFWNVFFDSQNQKAVIVAYGLSLPRPLDGEELRLRLGPSPEEMAIENLKFHTSKGARFGDTPSTLEALYGKPSSVTELKKREDAADLRFHFVPIRTEFQVSKAYGLLSVLIYSPGFAPDRVLRSR